MTIYDLKNEFKTLNQEETFYYKYHESTLLDKDLNDFISTLDLDFIKKHRIIVPELIYTIPLPKKDSTIPLYRDSFFFKEKDSKIAVLKHNRFSPALFHCHDFFEILFVSSGTCEHLLCTSKMLLKSGDICFIPPSTPHSVWVGDKSIIFNVLIKKSALLDIFANIVSSKNSLSSFFIKNIYSPSDNDHITIHTHNDPLINKLFCYTYLEYKNKQAYFEHSIKDLLSMVFNLSLRNYSDDIDFSNTPKNTELVHFELYRYLKDHFATVTLEELTEVFHYSPYYISKILKKNTGMTFQQHINKLKINKAKTLLLDTDKKISKISLEVGFPSEQQFFRTFKSETGKTPGNYRKFNSPIA